MRIHEEYKRAGYFWLPENPNHRIPGTLKISDGGEVELEIVGLFDESIEALNGKDDLSRIVGQVEKDGLVTLDNCFYRTKNIAFGGVSRSLVHVNKVFCGVAYDKNELAKFNSVSFSIEGINEWLGITGIKVLFEEDYKSATINYTPQQEMVYTLTNGLKLHIYFSYTLPIFQNTTEAKITQKAFLKLSSTEERELPEFIDVLHKITYLLCFATDETVTISDVSAKSESIVQKVREGKTLSTPIKIYYSSLPFSTTIPKIEANKMLFRFSNISPNAEDIFKKWVGAYSTISPSLSLYFSAVSGSHKYLEGRFLALAQALETYHRRTSSEQLMDNIEFRNISAQLLWDCPKQHRKWLRSRIMYGNEINLGKRIKGIIEPFKSKIGNNQERSKLIRDIVNTRNYFTHYSEELEKESTKGAELWTICQKMEAIFQLHLLKQLGFEKAEIEKILDNNYKLKEKISKT